VTAPRVTVTGIRETSRMLEAVARAAERSGPAAVESGQVIARLAAGIGPNRSGALAASYRALGDAVAAGVTSVLPYAGVIEWGSRRRGIAAQGRVAQAAARASDEIERIYGRAIARDITAAGG
jgi:hypothetical protein